jgi:hypothetical protein
MWCINCGIKLPDEAKFCFQCGTNLSEVLKNQLNNESNDELEEIEEIEESNKVEGIAVYDEEEVEKDLIFKLGNRTVKLPYLTEQYVYLEDRFSSTANLARESFLESYDTKFKNLEGMITYAMDKCFDYYEYALKQGVNFANFFGYNNFEAVFPSYVDDNCGIFISEIEGLADKYEKIMMQVAETEYNRAVRKASRGLWEGGGFGISGAIKGAITASAMNAISGSIHSIANGIGNTSTKANAESEFNRIYKDKAIIEKLADTLHADIMNMKECVIEAIEMAYGKKIPDVYSEADYAKSITLYNNLVNGVYKEEELSDRILDMLIAYPFDEDYYISALTLIPEIDGIEEYAEFFKVSYKNVEKEASEIREYRKKLKKSLGDAADKFEDILGDNAFYEKLKFKYTKNLVSNIDAALDLCNVSRVSYIYKTIDKSTEEKFFEAFENYAEYKNEVPILFYEESSKGKNSEGLVITNENVYFKDINRKARKIKLEDIEIIKHDGTKLILNDERIPIYMVDSKDRGVFVQLLAYLIIIIANSKLSGIETGNEIPDILKLRELYYGNGAELSNSFGQAKEILDTKLDKSSLYHKVKSEMKGDLAFDINLILENKAWDRIWYIYNTIPDNVRNKLDNAISTYANIKDETPILIHDATAFGSAKEGFVITEEAIYCKAFMDDAFRLAFVDISKVEFLEDKFILNDKEINFSMIDSSHRDLFAKALVVLVYRLIVEKCCPEEIRVKVKNKLKLNKLHNYNQNPEIEFNIDRSKTIEENIVAMLNMNCNMQIRKSVFVVLENDESKRRFNGAIKAFKITPLPNEALFLLYDNTVFGSGKEGFLLTNEGIIYKNVFSKPKRILFNDINNIESKGNDLIIGEHNIYINIIPKQLIDEFKEIVTDVIKIIRELKK